MPKFNVLPFPKFAVPMKLTVLGPVIRGKLIEEEEEREVMIFTH
jgi:hypothetical protein